MTVLDVGGIPTSLGEIINFKCHLDVVKHNYSKIYISFHRELWKTGLHTNVPEWNQRKLLWEKFLRDIGNLFFSQPPYEIRPTSKHFAGDITTFVPNKLKISPQKAELAHLLCKGTSLKLNSEYVVITTKTREFQRTKFNEIQGRFWEIMKRLASKHRIVVLGERKVEMRKEYDRLAVKPFGIYDEIMANLPKDRIVDLTVPALGETVSDLSQIQQDCLIMKEAKCVITFGIGGNSCLANAVANMSLGYRTDNTKFSDAIFENKEYPNAIITKNPERFLNAINYYNG